MFKKKKENDKSVAAIAYETPTEHCSDETQHVKYVCPACGYVADDTPPTKCPICFVSGEKFEAIAYETPTEHYLDETQQVKYVCPVCGYVADDTPPTTCLICLVSGEKFIRKP